MANSKHVAKLKEGVKTWNQWRQDNEDIAPDLRGAELDGLDLCDVNFADVDCCKAEFRNCSFAYAIFFGADLSDARIVECVFANADLRMCTWRGAQIYDSEISSCLAGGSDFSRSSLVGVDLNDVYLEDVDLSESTLTACNMAGVLFRNSNLYRVQGLESVDHHGPSTIDHQTLLRSGRLPLSFLRGCGMPEALIDYLPSLLSQPLQFYSCFISYSTKNQDFADRIYSDLQSAGVRCWFAPEHLKTGDRFRQRIDEAIRVHDKLLLVLSAHSVRSDWVREEVETAFERERRENRIVLFPIRLDNSVIETSEAWAASIRRQRHIGDFRKWKNHDHYRKALSRLLRDLKAITAIPRPSDEPSPD
jgi:uncharacterized protein YjbI with pentapeptide repeats